jgi:hypothetical protein
MAKVMGGNGRPLLGGWQKRSLASAASSVVAAALVEPAGQTASAVDRVVIDFALAASGFST